MQIHNTVLALQMMNEVKVYKVQFYSKGRLSPSRYHYKAAEELNEGDWVLVPTNNGADFGVARVVEEADDVDFDADFEVKWINARIDDPVALYKEHNGRDITARKKLASSQAMKAAEDHLKHLGVDATAFAIEHKTEENKE